MTVFNTKNNNSNLTVELNNKNELNNKIGDNMNVFDENKVKEVDVAKTNNKNKVIGYDTYYYCIECGMEIKENHKYCGNCGEHLIKENKGDKMVFTEISISDEEFDAMSLEAYEKLGTIAMRQKEDIDYEFDNLKEVFFKIIEMGYDLTKTKSFEEAKEDWFKSDVTDEDIFLDVFFEKLVW